MPWIAATALLKMYIVFNREYGMELAHNIHDKDQNEEKKIKFDSKLSSYSHQTRHENVNQALCLSEHGYHLGGYQ